MGPELKTTLVLVALYLASALLNAALAKRTPEQWEAWAEKNPRGAQLVRLLRGMGLDGRKVASALRALLALGFRSAGAVPPPSSPPDNVVPLRRGDE